jgi:hypothetical protein
MTRVHDVGGLVACGCVVLASSPEMVDLGVLRVWFDPPHDVRANTLPPATSKRKQASTAAFSEHFMCLSCSLAPLMRKLPTPLGNRAALSC